MSERRKPVHETLIEKVAEAERVDPTELPPLYDCIDPDALDTLCDSNRDVRLEFEYHGYVVTIEGADNVDITPLP